jgi:hypothetical protein
MLRAALILIALWGALGGASLAGQQPPGQPPDTSRLSRADSLRARQRALLERLARPPGEDTLELKRLDTLPAAPAPRRGQQGGQVQLSRDSVAERLMRELVGYQPVEYAGAEANFEAATRNLVLRGDSASKVTVRYQEQQVTADDSIRYNRDVVRAEGNPIFTPPQGDPVNSRRLLVDTRGQVASAFGARTTTNDMGAQWFVTGDLPRVGRDTVFASGANFTSDEQRVPYYHFAANNVKIVRGTVLVAMPVRLYFGDVPVLWLPFVAQSLSRGRASGLLTPRFSLNDVVRNSNGYQRRISNVGFYWAMNDYMDATVAMDWFSNNFTALTTGLRFRVLRHFLQGGINARQYWPVDGRRQFSLNGQQSWEISERMTMNSSIAYVSSPEFLRRNTFDPIEATQQISSSGGLSRRFDWGALNVLGRRTQSLSDDRVEMSLPQATFSIKPITLFSAPPTGAAWYNNVTWSGGGNVSRRSQDFEDQVDSVRFRFARADQLTTQGSANHSISIGNLSLGQNVSFEEVMLRQVPRDTLPFFPGAEGLDRVDIRQSFIDWSTSLSYQQTLIGQTSITPSVSVSSRAFRSDTLEVAQSFVSRPTTISFGAALRSQIYGFFPGFGPFERIRHRVSPGFTYNWAPEVTPTELQRIVFGSQVLQPTNQLVLSLSQTFEAKRRAPDSVPSVAPLPPPSTPVLQSVLGPDSTAARDTLRVTEPLGPGNPTRRPQGQTVTLLSLNTSSFTYDFVEADSAGAFINGFKTTRLRTEIGSDYLRGLSISFEHDLFQDSTVLASTPGGRPVLIRTFSPRLSQMNLRFTLNQSSGVFRWLGLAGDVPAPPDSPTTDLLEDRAITDDASILPGERTQTDMQNRRAAATQRRDWNLSVSYALTRPSARSNIFGLPQSSQTVNLGLTTSPTRNWRMSWRTSYDVDTSSFNDHMVSLTRDLHRWQANFDFMKTTTGNWQFRFEVTLLDATDLRFDYDQRSVSETNDFLPR